MFISPKNGILVTGELKPKSKFLGNSAATIMEGENRMRLLNKPEDGDYVITVSPEVDPRRLTVVTEFVDAKHVCSRYTVWENDARARGSVEYKLLWDGLSL